jgi:predicted negative regulator of RcsB-dependent stress response
MKRNERHHLKENELVKSIASARDFVEPRTKQLGIIIAVIVLIGVVALGVTFMRQQSSAEASRLLAEALVTLNAQVIPTGEESGADLPAAAQLGSTGTYSTEESKLKAALPKLKAAADAYPDQEPGIVARYHMAGALAALGRNDEAIKEFGDVVSRAGDGSLYGRMARLGQAETQARAGQVDAAIATWKSLAEQSDSTLPVDAILFELGRAYAAKGDNAEARKVLNQIVEQHPNSPYLADARTELDALKG